MSTPENGTPLALLAIALTVTATASADGGFGTPATDADIDRVFLTIMPDGENLPAGSGTAEQGRPVFEMHCASCHGVDGEGTLANRLVGGRGTLADAEPVKTLGSYWPYATTVFNYIRRSMPYLEPMSLSNDDYYAITAYLLNRNDIIAADTVIDRNTLPDVVMPNRDGFLNAYPDVPADYDYD
jgi:cytochrome c